MPGLTNNTDTVSALNQIIVALNELTIATRLCNKNDCIPISPPDGPGGRPGPNESIPPGTDEERIERRCKVAIFLVDEILYGFSDFGDRNNLDTYYNALLGVDYLIKGAIGGFVAGLLIGEVVPIPGLTPDDAVYASLGVLVGDAIAYIGTLLYSLDFGEIADFANPNGSRDELICALVNATNGITAEIAFKRVVNNSGLSFGNKAFIDRVFNTNLMRLLFYVNDYSPIFEQHLQTITILCPCEDVPPATPTTLTGEYKCKAANYIFDSLKGTTINLGGLVSYAYLSIPTFISLLAEGLLTQLMSGIFGVLGLVLNLPAIISNLSILAWRGYNFFGIFSAIATSLEADKTDIVCELYNAANGVDQIETARAALEARIDTYVDAAVDSTAFASEADTFKSVLKLLLSNAVLNALVEVNEDANDYTEGEVDCVECNEYVVIYGVDNSSMSFTASDVGAPACRWHVIISFNNPVTLEIDQLTGWTQSGPCSDGDFAISSIHYDTDTGISWDVYNHETTQWPPSTVGKTFMIRGSTQHTVTFIVGIP